MKTESKIGTKKGKKVSQHRRVGRGVTQEGAVGACAGCGNGAGPEGV
jgi:hypothetical protein